MTESRTIRRPRVWERVADAEVLDAESTAAAPKPRVR